MRYLTKNGYKTRNPIAASLFANNPRRVEAPKKGKGSKYKRSRAKQESRADMSY